MSNYDTMTDDEIDLLMLLAEGKGWNDCLDEMLKETRKQLEERKDAPNDNRH